MDVESMNFCILREGTQCKRYYEQLEEHGYYVSTTTQFAGTYQMKRLFRKGDIVVCKVEDNAMIPLELNKEYKVRELVVNHGQPHVWLEGFSNVRCAEWRFILKTTKEKLDWPKKDMRCICEGCKRWIGVPNDINNVPKINQMVKDAGWHNIFCHNNKHTKGRSLWYCPECAKKVTVAQMVSSV